MRLSKIVLPLIVFALSAATAYALTPTLLAPSPGKRGDFARIVSPSLPNWPEPHPALSISGPDANGNYTATLPNPNGQGMLLVTAPICQIQFVANECVMGDL